MKKTPLTTLALVTLVTASPLIAQVPDAGYFSFLSAPDRQTLLSQGELTTGSEAQDRRLAVRAPFAPELSVLTVKPTVSIEGLFLFPRPAGLTDLALYNAVNAVASMEGLEYYSVTRKRMEPLILASWRVVSADKPQKVPDPSFTSIPPFQKAAIFQEDNKLGKGLSEMTWKATAGTFVITLKNLQTLNYGFLPLVDPGNLQMLFVVVPLTDKVAVYGIMEARTAQLFGLEKSKDESFKNRMRALAAWLGQRIAGLP